ncbi:MAG: PAS domain S-box protein [Planctomycetota bacterium]
MANKSSDRKNQRKPGFLRKDSLNLYKFIRLVLGPDIPDSHIAERWDMDVKNFHEFKTGVYPVPRLSKLEELAKVLGVNKHLVFQAASGTSAQKVFDLIKRNDLSGQIKLLSSQIDEAHRNLMKSEQRYRNLFNHANDAIFIADVKTGILLDCNKQAENLIGRSKTEIIGMHQSKLHPPKNHSYHANYFKSHVKSGRINDLRNAYVITKDGIIKHVYISAGVMELDGQKVIQGIFREISQLKPVK